MIDNHHRTKFRFRLSLSIKILLATITLGTSVWLLLNYIQEQELKRIFVEELAGELDEHAYEDRHRFDLHVDWHHKAAKIIVSQSHFINYFNQDVWKKKRNRKKIKHYYTTPPPWMPKNSVLRVFYNARYAILIDSKGKVHEIYHTYRQEHDENISNIINHPGFLIAKLSHNQSYMTSIENMPYVIATESVRISKKELITLILISPIDNEFLFEAQHFFKNSNIIALVDPKLQTVISCSDEEHIPTGGHIKELKKDYLMLKKSGSVSSFFDYGASDLNLEFVSFLPLQKAKSLTNRVLNKNKQQRSILVTVLILFFSFLTLWGLRRIKRLTNEITNLSRSSTFENAHSEDFHGSEKSKFSTNLIPKVSVDSDDEIGQLALSFNKMIEERWHVEEALAAEKESLAVTLRSIGDGVITTDVDGNIVLMNKIAEELTGWSHKKAFGKPLSNVLYLVDEKNRQHYPNPVKEALHSGKIVDIANYKILIAKDGTERIIAESGAPIRDKNNQIVGLVLVFRDVTNKMKLEEELLKARKIESIGILAGGIAHDFNNILTAILGNISFAMVLVNSQEKVHGLLLKTEKAVLRAKELTNQLLTFSKGGEPIKKIASIEEIIKDSANFLLSGSNVKCEYFIQKNLWPVEIDKGQMSQVIQNIIINAHQSMPKKGVIEIGCENYPLDNAGELPIQPGKYVKISIRDNGIGIAPNLIDKIFDPYFTTKDEGSGLGLSITHSIIKKHGGHIEVKSREGVGTTFTIYLSASKSQTTEKGER